MKKAAISIAALLSGIVVVCFAAKLYRGWTGAEFAQHVFTCCASALITWRCLELAKRNGLSWGTGRLRFVLRVAFWIAVAVALFFFFKKMDH